MTRNRDIRAETAATVMVGGSAAFLAGAFMPVSRVYPEREGQRKLAILLARPLPWKVQQLLLATGAATLPIGVILLARAWDEADEQGSQQWGPGRRFLRGAGVAMAAGAVPFVVHLAARSKDPEAFALGRLPGWPFYSFTWLHLAGMAALGTGLRARGSGTGSSPPVAAIPQWPGWLNAGGAAVFGGALAATGDLPPLLVYGVELATGAELLTHFRRRPGASRV